MADHEFEVIVVGGGPTGMVLAGDLARAGRSVVVLERWEQVNPSSRAFVTMPRTMELFESRGLAEGLLKKGSRAPEVRLFGGAALDLTRLPTRYAFGLITPQTNVDRALAEYAAASGAAIHRGVNVVGLTQDADGVSVRTKPWAEGVDDGEAEEPTTVRAAYVVGADGAHSVVRDLIGLEFPGNTVLRSVVLADVKLRHGPTGGGLTLATLPGELGFLVPYGVTDDDGAWFRAMTWDHDHQLPDDAPVADVEVGEVLAHTMGRDLGLVEIGWRSRFHCDERQVTSYRSGRVFLAGDAAHVHSPMGGQGMNTGIGDGINLAWKLAAVLGGASEDILDTYQAERYPIGKRVLAQSGAMMRAATLRPRPLRWLRDRVAPRVLGSHRISDVIAGSFSGIGLRYGSAKGDDPLVGTRVAEVPLRSGTLATHLGTPGFVLITERGADPVDTQIAQAERTDTGPALLIRPDGHIAWAGTSVRADDGVTWRQVLARWTDDREITSPA